MKGPLMKFKDAFCCKINKLLTIDDVAYYYKNDKQFYKDNIEKNLICPECKQPNLSFNNDSPPYFSVYPKAKHTDQCTLKQDVMTTSQSNKYVNNPDNKDLVLRQIDSVLTMLLETQSTLTKTKTPTSNKPGTPISSKDATHTSISKRLPRKRIDLEFEDEDFECDKIFYGSVHLKWEKEIDEDTSEIIGYKMLLYRTKKDNKKMVCKLIITPKVYEHLSNEYIQPAQYNCKIVFVAKFKNMSKSYKSTYIRHSQFIVLEKVK